MTKKELAEYVGVQFYNLSTRTGGKFRDIHCLTLYEVTDRGTCRYICEVISCVANRRSYEAVDDLTKSFGYHVKRPTAANLTKEFLERYRDPSVE